MRFYYPENTDLSTLNTFTYMGGDGEKNFSMLFSDIEEDRTIINSAGIVILVAEGDNTSFDYRAGAYSTKFVQNIIKQKSNTRNSIAGFSTGGSKVFSAANHNNYDRIIVFSARNDDVEFLANKLKNKEILYYIPNRDSLYNYAKNTLNTLKRYGYKNVTLITNSQELINLFKNDFLVINPGQLMESSHTKTNVINSNLFSYANE